MGKKQYEEYEDRIVFRQVSDRAQVVASFMIFLAAALIPLGGIFFYNALLGFIVIILVLGFTVWVAYMSLTECQLVIKQKEKTLVHECIHSLSNKKKSKIISFSKITTIQIDISDELYGGTSEREMYEVIDIKFFVGGGEEFDSVRLKANREFRTKFNSVEQLVNKLQTFTNLPQNVFRFSSHRFSG